MDDQFTTFLDEETSPTPVGGAEMAKTMFGKKKKRLFKVD